MLFLLVKGYFAGCQNLLDTQDIYLYTSIVKNNTLSIHKRGPKNPEKRGPQKQNHERRK